MLHGNLDFNVTGVVRTLSCDVFLYTELQTGCGLFTLGIGYVYRELSTTQKAPEGKAVLMMGKYPKYAGPFRHAYMWFGRNGTSYGFSVKLVTLYCGVNVIILKITLDIQIIPHSLVSY